MENVRVDCPLCERSGAPQVFTSRDRIHSIPGTFAIHHCEYCTAYFIQPWLSAAELARYYPEQYGRYRHGDSMKNPAASSGVSEEGELSVLTELLINPYLLLDMDILAHPIILRPKGRGINPGLY